MPSPLFSKAEEDELRQGVHTANAGLQDLERIAKTGQPLFLFGAGGYGRSLAALLTWYGGTVVGFLDNNATLWGGVEVTMHGHPGLLPVYNPEVAGPVIASRPGAITVLTISTADAQVEVLDQCERLGIALESFAPHFAPDLAAVGCEEARQAGELWDDSQSRDLYRLLVRKRSGLDSGQPLSFEPDQYFTDFLPRACFRSFLDVGALNGDTFRRFLRRFGGDWDNYYAVEPQPDNFRMFTPGRADWPRLQLFNQAASDSRQTLRMNSYHSASSITDTGDIEVEADTLDNMLAGAPVTYIKMDIEGWEMPALRGAEGIIRSQKPTLAISVYHRFAHFWQVPLFLRQCNPDYRLRLRHHSRYINETVCYAF